MSVLSFGGCGDRHKLNLYAELLTDDEAVQAFQEILVEAEMFVSDDEILAFRKMLTEAGMKDDTAYQPQKDTIVLIANDDADTPNVKVLAPVGEEVSVGAVMLDQEHDVEILRNEELVFAY